MSNTLMTSPMFPSSHIFCSEGFAFHVTIVCIYTYRYEFVIACAFKMLSQYLTTDRLWMQSLCFGAQYIPISICGRSIPKDLEVPDT